MPSSRRTTGRGGGGGAAIDAAGRGDGGGGGPRVPPFTGNNRDHNPRELRSWARRTGFHPSAFFSGESTVSNSSFASSAVPQPPPPPPPPASSRRPPRPPEPDTEDDLDPAPPLDLERGRGGRTRRRIDLCGELEIPAAGGGGEVLGSAEPDAARGGRGDARRRNYIF